jgi:sortase A
VRNAFVKAMSSPALQGLFIAFFILAGLVLMGQAVESAWQLLAPASPPEDVRVVEAEAASLIEETAQSEEEEALLPSDVTLLDDQVEMSSSLAIETPVRVPVELNAPVTLTTVAATATPAAETTAPPAGVESAPLFSWEVDEGSEAPAEVVDVQPAHIRPPVPGNPTRIVIPSIRVDSPVINVNLVTSVQRGKTVSAWQVARNAVGFHHSSALPGTKGNAIMSAHNNAWGRIFRNLINIKRGDVIDVYVGDRLLHYKVEDKILVRQKGASIVQRMENADWIGPTPDERLTLVSCWPYRRATHRVIIIARPA